MDHKAYTETGTLFTFVSAISPANWHKASTTPFEPPGGRLRACPQPGNPLPNAIHYGMSASLEEAQMPRHRVILRQVARKNNIGCGAIYLPELPQASGCGATDACLVPQAFADAAGSVATSTTAVRGA